MPPRAPVIKAQSPKMYDFNQANVGNMGQSSYMQPIVLPMSTLEELSMQSSLSQMAATAMAVENGKVPSQNDKKIVTNQITMHNYQ